MYPCRFEFTFMRFAHLTNFVSRHFCFLAGLFYAGVLSPHVGKASTFGSSDPTALYLVWGESPRVKKSSRSNAVDRVIITNVKYKLNQTGSNWQINGVLDGNFERHLALFVKWTNWPVMGVGP